MAKRTSSAIVIAETFSCDVRDVKEYRYQPGRTRQAIYAIGERYFTVSATDPKDKEYDWKQAQDQWAAKRHNTVLWEASTSPLSE